jgi:hypothetical protein
MMTKLRSRAGTAAVTAIAALVGGAILSAQAPPAPVSTGDELLKEVRAMRGELNKVLTVSVRTQLLVARLQLQEQRIDSIARQLADAREKLTAAEPGRALIAAQVKMFEGATQNGAGGGDDQSFLEPLLKMFAEAEKGTLELKGRSVSLEALLASELARWSEFNSRLDEVEKELQR